MPITRKEFDIEMEEMATLLNKPYDPNRPATQKLWEATKHLELEEFITSKIIGFMNWFDKK